MQCYLMNKNIPVALIEYNTEIDSITQVLEVCNIEHAPLAVYNYKVTASSLVKRMHHWFVYRGIPSWRDNLDQIMMNLGIRVPEEILNRAFGLSLSDQYWLKPENSDIEWKDINFFDNGFDSTDFSEATFGCITDSSSLNFFTPNNTTDGMLKKTWVMNGDKRVLLKSGFKGSVQEPFNEWLASKICEVLGFDHVDYRLKYYKNNIVSACDCFITADTELISAGDIFEMKKKPNHMNDYEHYISVLEENGISDAREQMENMIMLDYIILNVDRHTHNFGIIRNAETLEWEKVAPIFDSGQAMCSQSEINFTKGYGKLFSNISYDFNNMISLVRKDRSLDFDSLMDIVPAWESTLHEWQSYSGMSDDKISQLVFGLKQRITMLEEYFS